VAVTDELACRENGRHQFRPVDRRIEPALEERDQVGAGIALHADRFVIDAAELAFRNVGVIALELLLGAQLHAVVGELALSPLAVLAGSVFAAVHGALRAAPDVLAHAAIDLVLRLTALGHRVLRICGLRPAGLPLGLRIAPSSVPLGRNRQAWAFISANARPRVAKRLAGP